MLKEFKKLIMRGNMMDLAVGMIIGAAFNAIVTSLVNDIFMPLLAWIVGKPDFSDLFVVLGGDGKTAATLAVSGVRSYHMELWQLHHSYHQLPAYGICSIPYR